MSILNIMVCMLQEICKKSIGFQKHSAFNIVIPESEIPKWFTHQSVGNTVSAQVTQTNENKWIGIAMCAVPMAYPKFGIGMVCEILYNGHDCGGIVVDGFTRSVEIKSDHLSMTYIPFQVFDKLWREIFGQIDENRFIQMRLRFGWEIDGPGFHQVGFRLVYEQDREDIREMLSAHSSNSTCITPYEGLDVHHNSIEGIKLKRSREECEGAGASGEGSSNDVTHSKRIER